MTMMLNIKDKYIEQLENFVNSLPKDAIEIKNSLDVEIVKRINDHQSGMLKTVPFENGLDSIKEKLASQI